MIHTIRHLTLASLAFLLALGSARAQMILPPDLSTQAAQTRFAEQILREMPSLSSSRSQYTVQMLVQRGGMVNQIAGLMASVRSDSRYMALAQARPLPMTFQFYTVRTETRSGLATSADFLKTLGAYYNNEYASVAKENAEEAERRIEARLGELIEAAARGSSMGVITGLGQVFPTDSRRQILGQKNLADRVRSLKEAFKGVKDAQLRESFDSERFGIARADLTKAVALKLLDETIAREQEIIHVVSLLELFSKRQFDSKEWDEADITWITEDGKDLPGFLEDREGASKLPSNLFAMLKSQARSAHTEEKSNITVEIPDRKLIVKEAPPHLAVFRSCAANDCSTGSSWAYPYSPMERDYYLYEESNPDLEIGYVSGNFLEVNGIPTFYLRDMTGVNVSPDQIDMIIQGFAASLPYLGVTQLVIAHESFHTSQNHYPPQSQRISLRIRGFTAVRTNFTDAWIRTTYLDRVVGNSGYDSPATHANGRLYNAAQATAAGLPVVRSSLINGSAPVEPGRKLSQKEMLERIRHAFVANTPAFLSNLSEDYDKWETLFTILRNERRLEVAQYYETVAAEMERAGLRLSKSVRREFPDLFYQGHLAARDAFAEAQAEETYELMLERYTHTQNLEILQALVGSAGADLFTSKVLNKYVQQYITRQRPADEQRIAQLWALGYRFETEMTAEQFNFVATHANPEDPMDAIAMMERVMSAGKTRFTDTDLPRPLLNLVVQLLDNYKAEDEGPSIRAAGILAQLTLTDEDILSEVKHSVKDEDNIQIRFPLAVALLRSGQELDSSSTALGYVFVNENLKSDEVPAALKREARAVLRSMPEETKAALQTMADEYIARKEEKRRLKEAAGECEDAATSTQGSRPRR